MHGGGGTDGKSAVWHESALCNEWARDLHLKPTRKSIGALPAHSQMSRFRGTDKPLGKLNSQSTHKSLALGREGI